MRVARVACMLHEWCMHVTRVVHACCTHVARKLNVLWAFFRIFRRFRRACRYVRTLSAVQDVHTMYDVHLCDACVRNTYTGRAEVSFLERGPWGHGRDLCTDKSNNNNSERNNNTSNNNGNNNNNNSKDQNNTNSSSLAGRLSPFLSCNELIFLFSWNIFPSYFITGDSLLCIYLPSIII